MAYRPAYVWNGSAWDTVGDPRVGALQSSAEMLSSKGVASGYTPLDSNILVPPAYLPGNASRAVTGSTTVTATDGVVTVTPSGATATATLPTPVGVGGRRYIVKKAAGTNVAYAVSVATAAGSIDGASTLSIFVPGDYREVISDGSNWLVIGGSGYPVVQTATSPANTGTLTLDATSATVFRVATSVAGWTLAVPTNGVDAQQINVEVTPTVAFSLTVNASILLTTGITSPISVTANKKLFLGLRYSGGSWFVLAAQIQA